MRYREWSGVFLGEAKPASVMPRARVEGRFVLLDVEMTRLACFRRKCLLGRNLITLFQCVNSFAKIFLAAPAPGARLRRTAPTRIGMRAARRFAQRNQTRLKNPAFNALFPQPLFRATGTARASDAWRTHPRNPCRGINKDFFRIGRTTWIWRRASPNARICANYFAARHPRNDCRVRGTANARDAIGGPACVVPDSSQAASSLPGGEAFRADRFRSRPMDGSEWTDWPRRQTREWPTQNRAMEADGAGTRTRKSRPAARGGRKRISEANGWLWD